MVWMRIPMRLWYYVHTYGFGGTDKPIGVLSKTSKTTCIRYPWFWQNLVYAKTICMQRAVCFGRQTHRCWSHGNTHKACKTNCVRLNPWVYIAIAILAHGTCAVLLTPLIADHPAIILPLMPSLCMHPPPSWFLMIMIMIMITAPLPFFLDCNQLWEPSSRHFKIKST